LISISKTTRQNQTQWKMPIIRAPRALSGFR